MVRLTQLPGVKRFDLARTILGRGRYWTVAYLMDGVLIDSGCSHTAQELAEILRHEHVEYIVNTHSHEDHIGGNAAILRSHPGVKILAHPNAICVLADPAHRQPLSFYRRFFWGMPEPSKALPVTDGDVIQTGRSRFRVYYTPGHSMDHISIFEENTGSLFTGDLYVGGRDRALRQGQDIHAIISSLRRMAELPVRRLLPGAARIPDDGGQALREKIIYLQELGERILEMHRQGMDENKIVRKVCGPWMPVELFTEGDFSRIALVRSYLNHCGLELSSRVPKEEKPDNAGPSR